MASSLIPTDELARLVPSHYKEDELDRLADEVDTEIILYTGYDHPPPPMDPDNPTAAELPNLREREKRRRVLVDLVLVELNMRTNRNLVTGAFTAPLMYKERRQELLGQLTTSSLGMYFHQGMTPTAAQNSQ